MDPADDMRRLLPESDGGTPRVEDTQNVPATIGRLVAIVKRLDGLNEPSADHMHKLAAPVVAAILDGYGKDDAAAERLRTTKQKISDKRTGLRGTAAWEMVALMAESREAFMEFAQMFCALHGLEPPQPKPTLTVDDLRQLALRLFVSNPTLTRVLLEEAALAKGAAPEEVLKILAGERK